MKKSWTMIGASGGDMIDDEWWKQHEQQLHELVGAKVTAVSSEFDEETLRLEKEDGRVVEVKAIYGAGYGYFGVKEGVDERISEEG